MMHLQINALALLLFVVSALAHYGEYVPKSFYVIDPSGHHSDVIYVRNRRDLARSLFRMRRGLGAGGGNSDGYASSSAHASASASASAESGSRGVGGGRDRGTGGGGGEGGGGGGYDGYNPAFMFPEFANFASNFPAAFGGLGSGAGARSFGSAYSSGGGSGSGSGFGNSGSGSGYGNSRHAGGLGAGNQAGYDGPILFSRFGEAEGTGIQGSAAAQGPNAAFSSVSTSSENGKVKYNVKSGKY